MIENNKIGIVCFIFGNPIKKDTWGDNLRRTIIYERQPNHQSSDSNKNLIRWALVINIILLAALILVIGRIRLTGEEGTADTQNFEDTVSVQKKIEPQKTDPSVSESKEQKQDYYILRVDHGYLAAYFADGECYMETEIVYDLLPDQLKEEIRKGKRFQTESELLSFLESYSS